MASSNARLRVLTEMIDDFIVFCNSRIEVKNLGKEYYYKEKIIELYPEFIKASKEK